MKQLFLFISACILCLLLPQQVTSQNKADTTWTAKISKPNSEWKKILTPEQYNISREDGTERAFTKGNFNDNHEKGMYYCICCNNPLFSSVQKFDSGTGWPSFWRAYSSKSVSVSDDNSLGMSRDAVSCQRCGSHLGHVFNDGPKPTGLRYCMDGLVLVFKK